MLKLTILEIARQQKIKAEDKLFAEPGTKALALLKRSKRVKEEETEAKT